TPTTVTERFDDIINIGGSAFSTFAVNQNGGSTSLNLASLSAINRPGVLNVTMEIGWGKVVKDDDGNAIGCNLQRVMQVTPSLTSQLSDALAPAVDYCANIADVGGLREPANFSIRITHP